MNYTINPKLIKDFREKVNEDFVFEKYKNVNGKNHWNIICSCMDWIDVAVSFIQDYGSDTKNIDVLSMDTYSYISSIDIIHEAVTQLHRVFIPNQSIPFKGKKYIFKNNNICGSDNEYFKEIRAAFGAHPVNIKNKHGKRYASWPTDRLSKNDDDFSLLLYSEEIEQNDIEFGFKFDELNRFLQERYEYLNHIIVAIDEQYELHKKKYSLTIVKESHDIQTQLQFLKEENISRFNNEYYDFAINVLLRIFNHNIIAENLIEKEAEYKNKLQELIREIMSNLQNMNLADLEYDNILNPDYPSAISYSVGKVFVWLDSSNDPLIDFHLQEINQYSSGEYNFDKNQPIDELFLKLKLLLYYENCKI
ncbi:MAG: hypothetical protein H7A25_01190 [Leptospiraceae bacterium]|nr:hypothetical protein [Leptospiraceae bacterium]MCP5498490.1 hypothetical protein [Leptospiraceae bacterium]